MPKKAGRRKRVRNPLNTDQYIDIPIVEDIDYTTGSGFIFQRRKYHLINDDKDNPTTRKVKSKTITHRAIGINGGPADPGDDIDRPDRVEVEVIQEFTTKTGSGPTYNKYTTALTHDPPENPEPGRKTFQVRIRHPEHDDWWIDVERTLEYTTKTGSGPTFMRHTHKLDWDHDAFNASVTDLPIDEDPDSGFDPPWRLDPYQNIVNVSWGDVEPSETFATYFRFENISAFPARGWGPPIEYPGAGGAVDVIVSVSYALAGLSHDDVVGYSAINGVDPVSSNPAQSSHSFLAVWDSIVSTFPGGAPAAAAAEVYILVHYQP